MKLILIRLARIALGLIVTAYGVLLTFPVLNATAYKLGLMHHIKAAALRMVPLWQATQVWHLCVWAMSAAMMLTAGVQTVRGRPAFRIFIAAFVVTAGLWWAYRSLPEYGRTFTPLEQRSDYYTLAVMLLVGAGVWAIERTAPPRPAAA